MNILKRKLEQLKYEIELIETCAPDTKTGAINKFHELSELVDKLIVPTATLRTKEIGNLIADAILGELSRQTAKEGSSYDRDRKRIVKGVVTPSYVDGQEDISLKLVPDHLLRVFKAGMGYEKLNKENQS